jgi:hypothetical protein
MARKKKAKPRNTKKTSIDLFGPPALLLGESEETYNELFKRVNEAFKPTDIFEEFAARDLTNAMMESQRFARLKTELLNANMQVGMQRVLKPLCNLAVQIELNRPMLDSDKIAAGWAMADPKMQKVAELLLDVGGLSMDAVAAETLSSEMDAFEGIDRLAMNVEARRYAIHREFERRREANREAAPPAPAALRARPAALDKIKANDNDKPAEAGAQVVDIAVEQTNMVASSNAIERKAKAAGG